MKARLTTYDRNTRPLIEYYATKGKYMEINGRQEIDLVTKELEEKLAGVRDV